MAENQKIVLGERRAVFNSEIALIDSQLLAGVVRNLLELADPNFYIASASSSGKYHSAEDCVKGRFAKIDGMDIYTIATQGGLVNHTKNTVRLAHQGIFRYKTLDKTQLARAAIAAAILHDACKSGLPGDWGRWTTATHGEICAYWVWEEFKRWLDEQQRDSGGLEDMGWDILEYEMKHVVAAIYAHMGRWHDHDGFKKTAEGKKAFADIRHGSGTLGAIIEEMQYVPTSNVINNVVQEADYYGSRKFVHMT